ncbi:4-hydroxyphenylacetate 3-monooxygenase reductase subunit [Leucobacter luti]|nr:flavin reductase [Leucobacter luti]MBL3701003.1 4-hydroxyphenylacetate 3-monooxygenase reductase subunit [Leucobacter luti]
MASLASAVSIVTTAGPAGTGGITVSAVSSVTDTPPTILVCVNRLSGMHAAFRGNGRLAINLLSGEQSQMALHFAGATQVPMAERLSWPDWETSDGLPVLRGVVVRATGRIVRDIEVGTHSVFFVELDRVETDTEQLGLAYFRRTFVPVAAASRQGSTWQFYDEWSDPGLASSLSQPIHDEAYRTGGASTAITT